MSKLLGSLAAGTLVKDIDTTYLGATIVWKIAAQNHAGYPADSTTLISEKCISTHMLDGIEPTNVNSDRKKYGNNRWAHSNLRQWLNSSGIANEWYTAQHAADTPPADAYGQHSGWGYDTEDGFLTNLSPFFVNSLLETTYQVELTSLDGGGFETLTDRIFLASMDETGMGTGGAFPIFTDNTSRIAYLTEEAVDFYNARVIAVGTPPKSTDTGAGYWIRNAHLSYPYVTRTVSGTGTLGYVNTRGIATGLRPLCNVKASILVSDNPDTDGAYIIETISKPILMISGEDIDLGNIYGGLDYEYTLSITFGAVMVTLTEQIDNLERKYFLGSIGEARSFSLSREEWLELPYGQHTAKITAGSADAVAATRTITFTKHQASPTISGSDADLGAKLTDFVYSYTVYDQNFIDDDKITVIEKINDTQHRTHTLTEQIESYFDVSGETLLKLPNGAKPTLQISATDSANNVAIRTITFTKQQDISVAFAEPILNDGDQTARPVEATMIMDAYIPAGAEISVKICNNGFDTAPTWEDCTIEAVNAQKYTFANTVKTAPTWGVNIRINITKNTALETPHLGKVQLEFKY